jgi:hypothetical protein
MSNLAKNTKPILFLTVTGLVSAVTTILLSRTAATIPLLPKFIADEIRMGFAGTVYGIAIALYFVSMERIRSVWRVLLFVVVSTCAYSAAVRSAVGLFEVWPWKASANMGSAKLDIPLPIPFGAGLLGAFLVLFAALYLFCPTVSQTRVLKLALAGCCAGGFFGVLGWGLGTLLPGNDDVSFICCFLAWQPGVSLTLGILLAAVRPALEHAPLNVPLTLDFARAGAASSATVTPPFSPYPTSTRQRLGFPVIAVIFFLGVAGFVAWRASRVLQAQRFARDYQKCVATAPSMNDLPALRPMTPDQALILSPIGTVSPKQSMPQPGFGSILPPRSPVSGGFSVLYSKPDETELRRDSLMIFVTVRQYPNAGWANYFAGDTPCVAPDGHRKRIKKLGHALMVDNSTYDRVNRRRVFIWNNGEYLITIRFDNPGLAEDSVEDTFLEPYLEKYPSTM